MSEVAKKGARTMLMVGWTTLMVWDCILAKCDAARIPKETCCQPRDERVGVGYKERLKTKTQ
jgi:G:T-mismatch repair DNA endonuclease (very short patch repair protein)